MKAVLDYLRGILRPKTVALRPLRAVRVTCRDKLLAGDERPDWNITVLSYDSFR